MQLNGPSYLYSELFLQVINILNPEPGFVLVPLPPLASVFLKLCQLTLKVDPEGPLLLKLQGDGLELLFKGTDAVLGSRLGALQVVKVGLKILELAGNLVLQTEQNLLKTNMESLIVIVPGRQALK